MISLFKCSLENLCLFISLHGFMYNDPTCVQRPFEQATKGEKFYFGFVIFYADFAQWKQVETHSSGESENMTHF